MEHVPAGGGHHHPGLHDCKVQFRQSCQPQERSRGMPATPRWQIHETQILPNAATILPRRACNLVMFFAWGLKHMLAGLVLLSAAVGLVGMGVAFTLAVPAWVALALYPAICSLMMLTSAAILSRRATQSAQAAQFLRRQA